MTIFLLLALVALCCLVAAIVGPVPLWVSVLILIIAELLRDLPLGK